jgi:glycosyltransferase involved in cell wall biosynthesis
VLHQTYNNWELIIVDDGSTDHSKEIVESFNDSRIHYIYQKNAERSAARNNGIKQAKGQWICFLDSDDEYTLEHLSKLFEFISARKPTPGLICTGLIIKSDLGKKNKPLLDLKNNTLTEIAEKFLIPTQVCVHRSILEKENFDPRFRLWEDTHLWLRIAAQYPVYQLEEYTAIQHIHEEGTVVQEMKQVKLKNVRQHIEAVKDLKEKYNHLFQNRLNSNYFDQYINMKYKMYLYQARQNRQLAVSLQIFWKGMTHQPSVYLLLEFPKIFLNIVRIGLH